MKYFVFIVAVMLSGCEIAVIVKGPSEPKGGSIPPPPICEGMFIPGKGCVKDAVSANPVDRGQNESNTISEPTR